MHQCTNNDVYCIKCYAIYFNKPRWNPMKNESLPVSFCGLIVSHYLRPNINWLLDFALRTACCTNTIYISNREHFLIRNPKHRYTSQTASSIFQLTKHWKKWGGYLNMISKLYKHSFALGWEQKISWIILLFLAFELQCLLLSVYVEHCWTSPSILFWEFIVDKSPPCNTILQLTNGACWGEQNSLVRAKHCLLVIH